MYDDDIRVSTTTEDVYGDVTDVVNIRLEDLHGHLHDFAIDTTAATELAIQLRLAVTG